MYSRAMQRGHYAKEKKIGNASKLKVGIVVSNFNSDVTEGMLEGALETVSAWKVKKTNITIVRVPGAFEIPLACMRLIKKKKVSAVIALGCIIKGETKHDEYIAHAVSGALQRIMLDTLVPVGFGVITPNTLEQALERSRGSANKGPEAAQAALEMVIQ